MKLHAHVLGLGIAALAAAICLVTATGNAAHDDKKDDPKVIADIRENLTKLAEAIEKNDAADTKKHVDALRKHELLPIMKQFKLREFGGMGLGKPDTISPDGIEAKLIAMGRKTMAKGELDKQGPDLIRGAYIMAAIAEVAKDRCPIKAPKKLANGDVQDPKEWAGGQEKMAKLTVELAKAIQAKEPDKVFATSKLLYSSCNQCHTAGGFRN